MGSRPLKFEPSKFVPPRRRALVGISGEGATRSDGSHVYVYLAAVREDGKVLGEAFDSKGLSHEACVKLLLSLPRESLCFTFSGSYHATKIFEELEAFDLFMTFHPEVRRRHACQRCGKTWRTARPECPDCGSTRNRTFTSLARVGARGYTADCHGFTVAEGRKVTTRKNGKRVARWARSTRVWDAIGFTHKGLDEALHMFAVGTGLQRAVVSRVAAGQAVDRGAIRLKAELIARLMCKVLGTLESCNIPIKGHYRGAGSIASTLMRQHDVQKFRGPSQSELAETQPELARAIMSAYFGGREEIAVQGQVKGPLWEYDLSGAYPHAMLDLPCLACGHWRHVTQGVHELKKAALGLVRFRVRAKAGLVWAPLPCRTEDGPVWGTNFEGWAWWPEAEAAMRGRPGLVEILDGYAYHTSCKHKPFAWVSLTYEQRCNLAEKGNSGGAGLVKAGLAAVYGKTAQLFESPVQSYVWAGLTTSLVRARVLGVLDDSVVSIATDAVIARTPRALDGRGLFGAWRKETYVDHRFSAFFAAPGLFTGVDGPPDGDWAKIIPAVRRGAKKVTLSEEDFFSGRDAVVAMIRCVRCGLMWDLRHGFSCPTCKVVGGVPRAERLGVFGEWGMAKREVSLSPYPMRDKTSALPHKCMRSVPTHPLRVRDLGGAVSLPYEPARLKG